MNQNLLALLLLVYSFSAYPQDTRNFGFNKYENSDTVVRFQEGVNEYSFLWTKKQGFYWDTISHQIDCHNVVFNILNDTKDTIFITKLGGGDGALLYSRVNSNSYSHRHPLFNAVFPNEILKISIRIYSIEHRHRFQKNLFIRSIVDGKEETFGISSWGYFVKGYRSKRKRPSNDSVPEGKSINLIPNPRVRDTPKRTEPTVLKKDGLNSPMVSASRENPAKNNSQESPGTSRISSKRTYHTVKIPYSISTGEFKEEDLYSGKIEYYNSRDELIVTKLIQDGREEDGYIYKGKKVNQLDSLGRKTELWLHLLSAASCREFRPIENAEKLYQGIVQITKYREGVRIDTQYTYNDEGRLICIFVLNRDSMNAENIFYHPDSSISEVHYYSIDQNKTLIRESVFYSDSLTGCIVKRLTYSQQKCDFTYRYINCQLYSKTSPQEKDLIRAGQEPTYEIIHHSETFVDEGKTVTNEWDEIISEPPVTGFTMTPIPYTVETGDFDASETFLVNGKIDYYDANGDLIESKPVVDGLIVE